MPSALKYFLSAAIAIVLSLGLAGCAAIQTPTTQIGTTPKTYQAVTVSYRVDSRYFASPSEATRGETKLRTIALQYPHPKCKPGFARAELIVERPTTSDTDKDGAAPKEGLLARISNTVRQSIPGINLGDGISEAWASEIPISEVERVVNALDHQGYFGDGGSPSPGVYIAAQINGVSFQKSWHSVDELDRLCATIRKRGTLVSHHSRSIPTEQLPVSVPKEQMVLRLPAVAHP